MSDDDNILHFPGPEVPADKVLEHGIATLERVLREARENNVTGLAVVATTEEGGIFRSWMLDRDPVSRLLMQGLLTDTVSMIGQLPFPGKEQEPPEAG